jgi:predicted neuraminidase
MKMNIKNWFLIVFTFAVFATLHAVNSPILYQEFVFKKPPFISCHASTLTQNQKGEILCAWFAGSEEGANDVAIWLARRDEKKWSLPHEVAKEDRPCWNPVLYSMPSGIIFLFYKAGPNPQSWSGLFKRSMDGGYSWSNTIDLPAGIIGPVRNRPLLLSNGTLLCGSSIESWRRWGCWMDMTSDLGDTWTKSTPINVNSQLFGIIQPALVFFDQDKIRLLARSHQIGYICSAESSDQGMTWTAALPTDLPNPNSAIDAINLEDGRILLVYNHSQEERYPLNIALSEDGGKTWKMKWVLENAPGEYSYPCVIQTKDKKVHISYTWNRKNIKYVILDPSQI